MMTTATAHDDSQLPLKKRKSSLQLQPNLVGQLEQLIQLQQLLAAQQLLFSQSAAICLDLRTSAPSISATPVKQHISQEQEQEQEQEEQQQRICMICEDRATGLHYGIITCEGCKGFFKRTVQNKRVYTCVSAENSCVVAKQHRNRCQSCRFQKCLQKGMVLAAVREDRMPGGRNSGAVYNLYKVKYKKKEKSKISPPGGRTLSSPMENNRPYHPIRC